MFDLKEQADAAAQEDKGIEVPVRGIDGQQHHDEDGNVAIIVVAGAHSQIYRQIERQQRRRKIKPRSLTIAAMHEETIDRVVACTLRWRGINQNGAPLPCTPENAKLLYTECPWVYEDVTEAMFEYEHFIKSRSQEPSSTSGTPQS